MIRADQLVCRASGLVELPWPARPLGRELFLRDKASSCELGQVQPHRSEGEPEGLRKFCHGRSTARRDVAKQSEPPMVHLDECVKTSRCKSGVWWRHKTHMPTLPSKTEVFLSRTRNIGSVRGPQSRCRPTLQFGTGKCALVRRG